jgi:BirA family transcriptional regulator, biotin operon repressor / biotin---[acetyl-CoA-carboxylase] ligase
MPFGKPQPDGESREFYGRLGRMNPEPIDADALARLFAAGKPGHVVQHCEETESTNEMARLAGQNGAAHGLLALAEFQTGGRGRRGTPWISPPRHNILGSLLLRPSAPVETWPRITSLAALSLIRALDEFFPNVTNIKWPNDIVARGRKLAGILAETYFDNDRQPFLVLGFGINVNVMPHDMPEALREEAISLRELHEQAEPMDRMKILATFLHHFGELWEAMDDRNFPFILNDLTARQWLLQKTIRCQVAGKMVTGHVERLDHEGRLVIRTVEGETTLHTAELVRAM